jgi:hypothetical protein
MDMDKYGIKEGINEVIVTTMSIEGAPNAAPIGIISRHDKLMVRVYHESQTCSNIKDTGLLAANLVYDPVLFVQSALGDLDVNMFEFIDTKPSTIFPVLGTSSAWVLFEADHKQGKNAITAQLHPITGNIKNPGIRSINRGFNAVIEAAIYATRANIFRNDSYLSRIKSYNNLINKCGGSREKEAYELILQAINKI